MYRLKDLKNGFYQIHATQGNQGYEGTPKPIFEQAVKLGVQTRELTIAVNQLNELDQTIADFDDNGELMRTYG